MPTLKQIHSSIELGASNIKLPEYGTTVGDGYTECFIAVPDTNIPFNVHMKSEGYIGPGLAFFVFMDGVYQTNRNRIRLPMPGPGVKASDYEVEFRVRQKEDKTGDGTFLGREWTFAVLDRVRADKAPNLKSQFINNVGTIEVVVLRCQADTSATPPPRLMPSQANDRTPTPTKTAREHKRAVSVREEESVIGGLFNLFDGACDIMYLDGAGDVQWTERGDDARPENLGELARDAVVGDFQPTSPHGGHGGRDLSPVVLMQAKAQQAGPKQFDGFGDDFIAAAQQEDRNQRVNFQQAPPEIIPPELQHMTEVDLLFHRLVNFLAGIPTYTNDIPGTKQFAKDLRDYKSLLRLYNAQLGLQEFRVQYQQWPKVEALEYQLELMKQANPIQPRPILKNATQPPRKDVHYDIKDFAEVKELYELLKDDLLREFSASPKTDIMGRPQNEPRLDVDEELPFRLKECLKDISIMKRCVDITSVRGRQLTFPHLRKGLGQMQCGMLNDKDLRKPIWNTVESIEAYLKDIESRRNMIKDFAKTLNEESKKILECEARSKDMNERLDELGREEELFKHQIKLIRQEGSDAKKYIVHFPLMVLWARRRGNFDDVDPHAYADGAYDVRVSGKPEGHHRANVQHGFVFNPGFQMVGQGVAKPDPMYRNFVQNPAAQGSVVAQPYYGRPSMDFPPAGYGAQHGFQMHPHAQAVPTGGFGAMNQIPIANAQFAAGVQQQNMASYGDAMFGGAPHQNVAGYLNPLIGRQPMIGEFRGQGSFREAMKTANAFPANMIQERPNKGMGPIDMEKPADWGTTATKEDRAWRPRPPQSESSEGTGSAYTLAFARNPNFDPKSVSTVDDREERKSGKSNKSNMSPSGWPAPDNANQDGGWETNNNNTNGGWASKDRNGWDNDAAKNDDAGWGQDNGGGWSKKDNGGSGNDNAASKTSNKSHKSSTTADNRSQRGTPNIDLKTHVKPYWRDWNKPPSDNNADAKKPNEPRDPHKCPALPRPAVPDNKAKDRDHGIQAGKGVEYAHQTRQPIYIDSMDKPYAAFTFKYRSKEAVKRILDIKIDDKNIKNVKYQAECDKLMATPKNKLVEDLAKLRMGLNRQVLAGPPGEASPHKGASGHGSNKYSSQQSGWSNDNQKADNGWDNTPTKQTSNRWDDTKKDSANDAGWGGNAWGGDDNGDNNAKGKGDNKKAAADAGKAKPAKKLNPFWGDEFEKASEAEVAKSREHFKSEGLPDARNFGNQGQKTTDSEEARLWKLNWG